MDIRIDSVNKSFGQGDGKIHVLKDVSCTINESEICTIVGASGSGKSTLLNCLGGLDRPDSGTILVGDREITSLSRKDLGRYRRDLVGFVFQFYNLVPALTARENVGVCQYLSDDPMPLDELTSGWPTTVTSSPPSSPAGSSSAVPSPAHSSNVHGCFCAMSPPEHSTTRRARRCFPFLNVSTATWARPSSSSRTTRCSPRWRTAPSLSATAVSPMSRSGRTPRSPRA